MEEISFWLKNCLKLVLWVDWKKVNTSMKMVLVLVYKKLESFLWKNRQPGFDLLVPLAFFYFYFNF